jgi:hypothetical protein
VLVNDIRHALGDDAARPRFVRTLHRFGYAFFAEATEAHGSGSRPDGAAPCWLTREDMRAPLIPGENIVGRGPTATIRIGLDPVADLRGDPEGVSRRHAMIVMSDGAALLHDLASKNGTSVDGVPVTAPVRLVHGVRIQFGGLSVRYEQLSEGSATRTLDLGDPRAARGSPQT